MVFALSNTQLQTMAVVGVTEATVGDFMKRTAPLVLLYGMLGIAFSFIFFGSQGTFE
jgi:hypothetical protein